MDVRFERVAEAVAAMHDFEHLALTSMCDLEPVK
jgi:hypothetical protein